MKRNGRYCSRDCYMKDRKDNKEVNPNYKDGLCITNYGAQVQYRKRNRDKKNARQRVYWAIRKGKIKKEACSKCGNEIAEAHHEDYDKPLDIIWLCKQCHSTLHYPTDITH